MPQQPQPQWQPITQLALIASHIDGMLEAAQEQYQTLQPARAKPHVLDNYTVGRVTEVFTAQKNDLWLFDEQLKRWAAQSLTSRQRTEVQRLTGQMATASAGDHRHPGTRRQIEEGNHRAGARQK